MGEQFPAALVLFTMTETAGGCNDRMVGRIQKVIGIGLFGANWGLSSEVQMQVLRLTTPNLHPTDEDLSVGTPGLESAWGPFRSG